MTKFFLIINFLFLIILNKSKLGLCQKCEAEFYVPNESEPIDDDIQLLVNETLIVNCKLLSVTPECHSSNLFFENGINLSNYVKIVDNSTIQLLITNMAKLNDVFNCKYKNEWGDQSMSEIYGVGQVAVRVGYKPEILNFSCISINLDMMECTMEQISNPLILHYTIRYGPTDEYHGMPARISEKLLVREEESKVSFTIDTFSRLYRFYYIEIVVKNDFGLDSKTYWIDVIHSTKPIVENLSATGITSNSVSLIWRLSSNFGGSHLLDVEYVHQVKIFQKNYTDESCESWRSIDSHNTKKINQTTFQLSVNLDYANTWYDIRVSTCVRNALYNGSCPSANVTFETSKRKPDSPPEVAVGGFEILHNHETKIYWKETPPLKWNSNYMFYEIVEVMENGQRVQMTPEYKDTIAKFHGLQHKDRDYQFKMLSRNSEGNSREYSVINIPRLSKRIAPPHNLKKRLSNSIYTLTWNYSNLSVPDNYTIFWCKPVDEQPTLCGKLLGFAYVNSNEGNTFTYNNNYDKETTKIFAISSNYNDKTSGMKWFPCSVTENQDMTLFPAELEVLGPTAMKISWNPQCATPLLKGFNISYCPIYNPNYVECNETKLYSDVSNSYHIIENLLAYTTYLVKISMFDGKKSGPIVDRRNVTDSCQPTVPHDLGYERITNSSIKLKWSPPEYWNGQPQFYNISYNRINSTNHQYHREYKIVDKLNENSLPNSYELENLRSYSDYIIQVAGCNPACSNFSNEIKIKTLIGKPDKIHEFTSSNDKSDSVTYQWLPPEYKAGRLDFYEILFEAKINGEIQQIRKIQIKSNKCTPVKKLCNKKNIEQFHILVRAVNVVPLDGDVYSTDETENISYHTISDTIKCREEDERINFECGIKYNCIAGDWLLGINSECYYDSDTVAIITIACFCIGLGMLIGLTLVCKKVQQIKNVGTPELPPGIKDIMETKPPSNNNVIPNKSRNMDDEQKIRLISESKSIDESRIYMDNDHYNGDMDYSYNSDNFPSSKQSTINFLNLTNNNLNIPYGYEIEANPVINYVPDSNTSNYDYDGESINQSETMSYDSTQSIKDSNEQSMLTENTNTDSNYVPYPIAPCIINPQVITSNGYVRVSDILKPKPTVSSGYVTIADLSKQNINVNTKPKLPATKDILWPENGYVKPKHLADIETGRIAN